MRGEGWSVARLEVLLDRTELRAWQIEVVEPAGVASVHCPLGSGRAQLAWAREPRAPLVTGAFVVARSMPVGPGRWVLLGRARVVAPRDTPAFERLLRSLRAPRGEFWRVHGGVLSQAARAA